MGCPEQQRQSGQQCNHFLDGLLYQDSLPIREHYTDTTATPDLLFGLFELLGFPFTPRLRDLPDQTLYRARRGADYGSLSGVLRRTIRDDLIVGHWDDLNRLAASLADGLVPPSMLVSKLQGLRRQNALQQAIQELGRLAKTRHLLALLDDAALRRRVLVGLNRQERVHAMARAIFFGPRLAFRNGATRRS